LRDLITEVTLENGKNNKHITEELLKISKKIEEETLKICKRLDSIEKVAEGNSERLDNVINEEHHQFEIILHKQKLFDFSIKKCCLGYEDFIIH